jgi:hypothetical protein
MNDCLEVKQQNSKQIKHFAIKLKHKIRRFC